MNEIAVGLLIGALFLLISIVGGGFTIREIHIPVVPLWARIVSVLVGLLFIGLPLVYPSFYRDERTPPGQPEVTAAPTATLVPTPTATVESPGTSARSTEADVLTATPAALELPATSAGSGSSASGASAQLLLDISGEWRDSSGGYLEFTRSSPLAMGYGFLVYDTQGSSLGGGSALLQGETLYILNANSQGLGDYTGELEVRPDRITGVIRTNSGEESRVTFTGAPSPLALPPPAGPDVPAGELSGVWNGLGGGYLEFTRSGPIGERYSFQEFDHLNSVIGSGSASRDGDQVTIERYAYSNFLRDYSGQLKVSGNRILGAVETRDGVRFPVILVKDQ